MRPVRLCRMAGCAEPGRAVSFWQLMHESGLAASIAETLRHHGLDAGGPPIRLVVRGGHSAEAAFDDALRLHLELRLPTLDQGRVTIVHEPREATCVDCGLVFGATSVETPCPTCGGPGLSRPTPESVEVEWTPPCA